LRRGVLEQASSAFQKAVALDPELAVARNDLGVAYLSAGMPVDALREFLTAAILDPSSSIIYLNLGRAYLANGQYIPALDSFQQAANLEPDDIVAWLLAGQAALAGDDLSRALKSYETVFQTDSTNQQALLGLGVTRLLQERPGDALGYLDVACILSPDDAVAHYFLGVALAALQHPSEARVEYQQVLALSKDPALVAQAAKHLEMLQDLPGGNARQGGGQKSNP
jgi:Flp pilus assembly protein TadD